MIKKTVIEQMIGLLRTPIAQRKGINISPDECLIWAGELEKELKSLPERFNLQPKQEWSEEDEKMLDEIIDFFENGTVKLQHDLSLYASRLKSIKNMVIPQPKQEWDGTEIAPPIDSDVCG